MEKPQLNVEIRKIDHLSLLEADGDIDLWTADSFAEAVRGVIESGCEGLVLDLRKVRSMDAGVIKHLIDACKAMGPDRKLCAIARGMPERLIRLTRLDEMMELCSGIDSAKRVMGL